MAEEMSSQGTAALPARGWTTTWGLPLFLTPEGKYPWGWAMFTLATILYLASNHFHLTPPQMLPMYWIDHAVPFIPETVWIYVSEYFYFAFVYIVCRDLANLNKYLYSFLALQTTSVLIFVFWPTTYPRELFPLDPQTLDHLTFRLFESLRVTDTAANCCPSLHVSSVYLSAFIFLDDQKKKFPFFFAWGTLIAMSTMTTKQHYFIDVVVGFAMAVIFYWMFHRYVPYRPYKPALCGDQAKR